MSPSPSPIRGTLSSLFVSAALAGGCRGSKPESERRDGPAPVPSSESARAADSQEARSRDDHRDLVTALPMCELEHQGRLLDFGTDALMPWSGFRVLETPSEAIVTRDAATYLEVAPREL